MVPNPAKPSSELSQALEFASRQVRALVTRDPDFLPMYTTNGKWRNAGELWTDWCGGFLGGMMWLIHRETQDPWWQQTAEHYARLLEHRKRDRNVHDLGFIFRNTYRRWYQVTNDARLMDVVAEAGVTLAGRFQKNGQYLASFLGPQSLFIDIMMNVPLLFEAADWLEQQRRPVDHANPDAAGLEPIELAGWLRRIATAHCLTSQRVLVRPDGSTAHEAIFDPVSGEFVRESTQQGLRPDSCWSRGLAWALYGFGTVYSQTRDRQFLETACRCADWFIKNLPGGGVPYWDFDLPDGPDRLWDSSAAAIAASGLLQLSGLFTELCTPNDTMRGSPGPCGPNSSILGPQGPGLPMCQTPLAPRGEGARRPGEGWPVNCEAKLAEPVESGVTGQRDQRSGGSTVRMDSPERSARYRAAALKMLSALCQDEFLAIQRPGWEGILCHAVYHFHKKLGVDESVMWGDHFFVEAIVRALGERFV